MTIRATFETETKARLAAIRKFGVDVAIIGAGINGAGLFRDLCEQGVSCLIVDKNDFGSGTSAASSRLIHGGLKYLETGEFGLVAQSTFERNLLLKNAPHTVTPLETVIPIFSWTKGIGAAIGTFLGVKSLARSRGALLVKVGLTLFDIFGRRERTTPKHRMMSRNAALKEFPALSENVKAAGVYYDAQVSRPERLVWELIRDGLDANPASAALNYCALLGVEGSRLRVRTVEGEKISVEPRIVINAAGPWIDKVSAQLGTKTELIGGTKGSHILLDNPDLVKMLKGRMIYFEANDGRICLVYEYDGLALVGSTDQKFDDPDHVKCEDWEIEYFFERLQAIFPGLTVTHQQMVYAYSGIRPLPASNSSNPGLISRDHSTPTLEPEGARPFPVIALVGGKWTTFRGFAEEVTDDVLRRLGRHRILSTQDLAIGGGKDFPRDSQDKTNWLDQAAQATGLPTPRLEELLGRYGTTALAIVQHKSKWTDADRLPYASNYSLQEIDWIVAREGATTLGDVVLRRTTLAIGQHLTLLDIKKISDVFVFRLGWTVNERKLHIRSLAEELLSTNRLTIQLSDRNR